MRPRRRPNTGFTLVELLVVISIISLLAALLLPVLARTILDARRTACVNHQHQLYVATRGYLTNNADLFPLAWHKSGGATDLGDVSFFRFLIHEYAENGFRHVVDDSGSGPQTAADKYRLTREFWQDPSGGWTREYFAPFLVFRGHRDSSGRLDTANPTPYDKHAQFSQLTTAVPATERPMLSGVDASHPNPDNDDPNDPAHEAEMHSGWTSQLVTDAGLQVFVGAGQCLRTEGDPDASRLDFRHNDIANFTFLDSHVESIRREDKTRLRRIICRWNHLTPPPGE